MEFSSEGLRTGAAIVQNTIRFVAVAVVLTRKVTVF